MFPGTKSAICFTGIDASDNVRCVRSLDGPDNVLLASGYLIDEATVVERLVGPAMERFDSATSRKESPEWNLRFLFVDAATIGRLSDCICQSVMNVGASCAEAKF